MTSKEPKHVKAFFLDNKQRYWVTTNDDATIRIYDKSNKLLGYLGRDGHVHSRYISFGSPIYHIMQDRQGTIWMCSKPDGLFRLKETGNGIFSIEHFRHDPANKASLGGDELYCTAQDPRGRLWVATFNDGLQCVENPKAKTLSFTNRNNGLHQPDNGSPLRVHYIYITKKGVLLGATTEGLLIGDVSAKNLHSIKFRLHKRDANRSSSLSNNAVVSGSKQALLDYLAKHPDSEHKLEAEHKIDSIDWSQAESANTIQALQAYLDSHANGEHVD